MVVPGYASSGRYTSTAKSGAETPHGIDSSAGFGIVCGVGVGCGVDVEGTGAGDAWDTVTGGVAAGCDVIGTDVADDGIAGVCAVQPARTNAVRRAGTSSPLCITKPPASFTVPD